MKKNARSFVFYSAAALLLLIISTYSFTQALQVPLNEENAEKVLTAGNIWAGEKTFTDWRFHPLELPVYLLFVRVFGLGTFSSVGANLFFFMCLFCTGLLLIKANGLLTPSSLLIWTAMCGLPDPAWMRSFQAAPFFCFSMLMLPHFLSKFLEHRKIKDAAAVLFITVLAVISIPGPEGMSGQTHAVHETIRALQTVFRADFSMQPLLKYSTGRYFLMTLIMLIMLSASVWTLLRWKAEKNKGAVQYLYALFILLTILFCCLPVSGDRVQKSVFCAWLPFGTALLLIFIGKYFRDFRLAQQRFSFTTIVNLFFVITLICGISPITLSRPASSADKVILFLNQEGLHHGYCEPQDHTLLKVAAKGEISFSADRDDPENEFLILTSENNYNNMNENNVIIGKYTIIR